LTVGAAAFAVSAAYNVAPLPGPQFGSADYLLQFSGAGQKTMRADIAEARKAFGTVEVIGRQFVSIPGSAQTIEYRALSPGVARVIGTFSDHIRRHGPPRVAEQATMRLEGHRPGLLRLACLVKRNLLSLSETMRPKGSGRCALSSGPAGYSTRLAGR
jgi:hypothetical protein